MSDKEQRAKALVILLDLEDGDEKEIAKMKATVINRMYEGLKKNALAYQHMSEIYKQTMKRK